MPFGIKKPYSGHSSSVRTKYKIALVLAMDDSNALLPLGAKCYRAWCYYAVETYCAKCDILFCYQHWHGQRCDFCGYEITFIPRTIADRARARRLAGVQPGPVHLVENPNSHLPSAVNDEGSMASSSTETGQVTVPSTSISLSSNQGWRASRLLQQGATPTTFSSGVETRPTVVLTANPTWEPRVLPPAEQSAPSRRPLPLPNPRQSRDTEVISVDE